MVVAVEDFPILNHHQSQDTLPETNIDNSSPLKIDHLEVRRFLLETAIFRDEHLSFREGSHETLPTFLRGRERATNNPSKEGDATLVAACTHGFDTHTQSFTYKDQSLTVCRSPLHGWYG